ncbi:DUF4129 domain-containing protein [Lentibacillus sp. CBA3610]|uniref:DUF4129 domain-containing protein n=1 Tax=Lentibacillus sp. CBA3610 TaxID=2518176 RepID=UPI00159563DE|nr:DUF4129 domain-containing protein [Lentibacillus sp. CBA3610]QKY69271.1 DUF4129 domain-containing protein [Lentibacillus sp. CBA3610]
MLIADAEKAREELQTILNQNDYQIYYEENRNFLQIWWDRLTNWIGEQLAKLFSGLEPSSGFADMVLVVIIIAVLALIGFAIFYRVRHAGKRRTFYDYQPLKSMNEASWSYNDHLQAVRQQESGGDYNEAARHMFLALLLYFHDREWLKARNWKTNWEYFAELQQVNRQLADAFYQLALVFDEVVYGERRLVKDDYDRYRHEAMRLLEDEPPEISGEG